MMAEQRLNCSAEQLLNCALTSSSATGTRSNDSGFLANCVPQEESRFQNEFKIVGELGEGGFGRVYQVANKTDRKGYAIKIVELPQNEDDHDKAVNEAQILSNLVHGNVVRYYGAWKEVWVRNGPALNKMTASDHTDENDSLSSIPNSARDNLVPCLFIQMELCPISLRQVIDEKKYKKDQLAQLFFELVQGVHYIHNQGYFHRDVNPNNIFIGHDKQVKIGDFGLARLHINAEDHDHVFSENVGTLLYQAPEMRTVKYDKSSDIYSLGIVFFEILYPMDTASERCNVLKKLRTSDITFPGDFLEHASPWHKMLLQSILNHVPDERPSLENILDQMSDNYTLQHTEFSKERALKSMFKAGNIESFSYDMLENIRIIPPQHNILRSIETIFRRYGADQLQVPLLTPRYSLEGDLTSAAELITKAGLSVCLPSSSRTNFARFILLNSIKSMKRYDTLRTFKEISGQYHPKQRYECVLDIVSSDPVLFKVDAQILQVLISLDNFINDLYKGKGHIRTAIAINHVDIVMSILLSVGVQLQDLKNVLNLIGTSGYQAIMTPGDHHINKEKLERILKLKGSPDFIERKVLQEVHEEFIPRVKNAFQHLKNTLDYLHETMCLFSPIIKINVDCCSNVQFCSGLLFSYSANNGTCLRDTVVADGGRYDNILDSLRSKWCLKTEEEIERWCGLTVYPWEIVLLVADFFPPEFVILTCHAVELEKKVHLLAQILRGRGFNCNIKWNLKAPEIEALKDDSSVLCLIEYHENSVKFFHKYSNVSKNGRFYWEKRCNPNPPSIIMPYDQFHQMVLRSFPKFPFKFQEDIFTVRREPATEPVVGFICSVAIARPPQNFFYVAD